MPHTNTHTHNTHAHNTRTTGPWAKIELPREAACRLDVEVVVKITDTCPCRGNEQWCCGKPGDHLDLSNHAFGAIVSGGDIGVGIIGIDFR